MGNDNDTMRDAMEAAFDEAETNDEEEEAGGSPEDTAEPLGDTSQGTAPGEELGGEEEPAGEEPGGESEGLPAGEQLPAEPAAGGDAEPLGGDQTAPVSWTPAAREHWAGIPPEARAEINRRERDISQGLQQASGHKRVAEEYFQVIAPFKQYIQAAGSTPSQAVHELMTTATQLTMGSPSKKAQVVQNIIAEYGVDIGMLDELLAGQPPVEDPNAPLLTAIDQRLAPINEFMGGVHEQRKTAHAEVTTEAATELAAFQESHGEYYEDLREDMADLLEMAANRGRSMTMEQAYEKAADAHPQIGPILQQRKAAEAGNLSPDVAARKRAAASSIRGTPNAGGAGGGGEQSTRALMSELWDDAESDVGHG
jgi:hypothetical protein